ncbi:MAG TPA: hypothetical protein PKI08_08695, partial [Aquaticitalea sp.]|nr:hypothetical protein [Aquaticitalea sp.]
MIRKVGGNPVFTVIDNSIQLFKDIKTCPCDVDIHFSSVFLADKTLNVTFEDKLIHQSGSIAHFADHAFMYVIEAYRFA